MAHFYGEVFGGSSTSASRRGFKNTGIHTNTASWQGAVRVELSHHDGVDHAHVSLRPWQGRGVDVPLYNGPVGDAGEQVRAAALLKVAARSDNETVQNAYRNLIVAMRLAHPNDFGDVKLPE